MNQNSVPASVTSILSTIHKVDGFDPTPLAVEYMDLTTQEKARHAVEPVDFPFAGGSGAGVSVQPVGFLVVQDGSVRMLPATCSTVADRVVELIPTVMEDVKNFFDKSGSAGMR